MILLVAILLKSLIVFAFAGFALLWLRRGSAAVRHLVCLLTLAALLVLPGMSLLLPGWKLPVAALPVPPPATVTLPAPPDAPRPVKAVPLLPPSTSLGPLPSLPPAPMPAPPRPFSWPVVLPLLWLLGVFMASLRPLLGLWGLGRLSRLCEPVTDAPTLALAQECAVALHLKRTCSFQQAAVPVPMTWGWRRPVVLLPTEASAWPEDQLRSVLLHELAHIKRGDWLWHRLADAACALYWFHPLVWLIARRLRAEGEIACDDLVLSSGIAAPDYARHLLEIAHALAPAPTLPQAAIAMAQTSHIEGRLTMILDQTHSRRQMTRRALLAVLGIGIAVLVPLTMLRPAAQAQVAMPATSKPAVSVTPVIVRLLGLTDSKGHGWDQSGAPLPAAQYRAATAFSAFRSCPTYSNAHERTVNVALRLLPQDARDLTVQIKLLSGKEDIVRETLEDFKSDSNPAEFERRGGDRFVQFGVFQPFTTADLHVGVSHGPWAVAASSHDDADSARLPGETYRFSRLSPTFDHLSGKPDGGSYQSILLTAPNEEYRVTAVDVQDKTHSIHLEGMDDCWSGHGDTRSLTARFEHLPPNQIREVRVETRPITWTVFKNIALQPAK